MRGLKFLFVRWARYGWSIALTAALFAGMVILCCCAVEMPGGEEYLMSGAYLPVAYCVVPMMGAIISFANITGNRLMLSCPIARELYTVSVPLFIIVLTLGSMAVADCAYFISLAARSAPAEFFSDAFVFMAIGGGLDIIALSLFSRVQLGGMITLYVNLLPYIGFIMALSNDVKRYGFGLPLWISALIFVGAVAAASIFSFAVSRAFYKRMNFKAPATVCAAK